jgi:transposase-like protein
LPAEALAMREELRFPQTEEKTNQRPARCPHCEGKQLDRHGVLRRRVVDPKLEAVEVVRYRCRACRKTLRVFPSGVRPRYHQTLCEQVLSATLYGLGLSYDKASWVLTALGCGVVKATIWENVQALGEEARRKFVRRKGKLGPRPVVGIDETQIKVSGQGVTVGFVTDPKTGELVGMRILASREGEELARWLSETAQELGCEVVVTDELESYKPAAEKAGTEQQLCLAHWRKAVARRLKKIEGYPKEKELIREALKQLDPPALRAIRWLHRHFAKAPPPRKGEHQSPAYAMRMLTLDCLENWNRLTCYQKKYKPLADNLGRRPKREYAVPSTNNACENAIGRGGKIRHKAMRGYKSLRSALLTSFFLASLAGVLAAVPYQSLLG